MKNFKIYIFITLIITALIFSFSYVDARVGGGQSYGGGGGGGGYSGGGGGDGGGEVIILLIRLLIWLIIECPVIGIPLTIIIIVIFIMYGRGQSKVRSYGSSSYVNTHNYSYPYGDVKDKGAITSAYFQGRGLLSVSEQVKKYKDHDPNFSRPLFLDFVQLLYAKVQIARGDKKLLPSLAPYLSKQVMERIKLNPSPPEKVEDVVIGSSNITQINSFSKDVDRIVVEFEANYREHKKGKAVVYYEKERWTFQRKHGVLSKGPEDISSLHCPSCGSPVELRPDGMCPYCKNIVNKGDFHWQVFAIMSIQKCPRPPLKLGGGGVEVGTSIPDVVQPNFEAAKRAFQMRYPNFSWGAFQAKVDSTFMKLQQAWTSNDWEAARSLETDPLFSSHKYWIERYKAEGLRNCLEDIKILSMRPVKIEQDAFYESITLRIKAQMKDYTVDKNGRVLDGSKTQARTFSEYWTFIRRGGFAEDKKEKKENQCPNCGAPIKLSMAGICEYCGSKITSGDFDWILSGIEQDEAYEG